MWLYGVESALEGVLESAVLFKRSPCMPSGNAWSAHEQALSLFKGYPDAQGVDVGESASKRGFLGEVSIINERETPFEAPGGGCTPCLHSVRTPSVGWYNRFLVIVTRC